MCGIIKVQDARNYRPVTRPLRLHGHVTSLRLEAAYWQILEEIAQRERMSLSRLAAALYDEMCEHGGEVTNFASCLRVTCLSYVAQRDAQPPRRDEVATPKVYHLDFPAKQNSINDSVTTRYYPRSIGLE